MKPLPAGEELTMRPKFMASDFWAHGLLRVEKSEFLQELDSITGRETTTTSLQVSGKAGDPVPYRFRTDNFVTIVLMGQFLPRRMGHIAFKTVPRPQREGFLPCQGPQKTFSPSEPTMS